MNMRLVLILLFLGTMYSNAAINAASIHKVFYNQVDTTGQGIFIELGNLVLYVDKKVDFKPASKKTGAIEYHTFFIPAQMTSEADVMFRKIRTSFPANCSVSFDSVSKPEKGIHMTIGFDPQKIGIRVQQYESISMQKSIVLSFYNKDILDKLNGSKPIIETAHYSPRSIVIDCGHGGTDCGVVGCNNLKEKDITLQVGGLLADELQKSGMTVYLARKGDSFLGLDERATFANRKKADLFISIHSNSGARDARGIETYALRSDLFSTVYSSLSGFQEGMINKYMDIKYQRSDTFAHEVHTHLVNSLNSQGVVDRHVKHKVPQVLLGAGMPSILVEIGFLTNEHESRLLANSSYQKMIATGISRGILSYLGRC